MQYWLTFIGVHWSFGVDEVTCGPGAPTYIQVAYILSFYSGIPPWGRAVRGFNATQDKGSWEQLQDVSMYPRAVIGILCSVFQLRHLCNRIVQNAHLWEFIWIPVVPLVLCSTELCLLV